MINGGVFFSGWGKVDLMMITEMKSLSCVSVVAALGSVLLFSCSSNPLGKESEFSKFQSGIYQGLEEADSLKGVKIPILRAPDFEAKWGKPKIRVSESGNYELNYANPSQPFDRLAIYGSVKPFPKLKKVPKVIGEKMIDGELTGVALPQEFRAVKIEGQSVRWFQEALSGGADGAYYSTEGFSLTDASGNTGYYRMVVEAGNDMDDEVARRFSSGKLGKK